MKPKKVKAGYLEQGRSAQKVRTRQRVLEAASELIGKGHSPTITEAADLADVSRRTAYRYFSTQQQMLAEAALAVSRESILQIQLPRPVEARIDVTVRALQEFVYQNEAALRMLAQMYMQQPLAGKPMNKKDSVPPRVNRVKFIESALADIRSQLPAKDYERLISALVLCMGVEAAMSLRYVRNLSSTHATEICSWAAQQIIKGALSK
jgi:AcrR family transcriptional regulator